jgi:hypothetical protein
MSRKRESVPVESKALKLAKEQKKNSRVLEEAVGSIHATSDGFDDFDLTEFDFTTHEEGEEGEGRTHGEPIVMESLANWTKDNLGLLMEDQLRFLLHQLPSCEPPRRKDTKDRIIDRLLRYKEKVQSGEKPLFKPEAIKPSYWRYVGQVQSKEVDAYTCSVRNIREAIAKAKRAKKTLAVTRKAGDELKQSIDDMTARFGVALKKADYDTMSQLTTEMQKECLKLKGYDSAIKDAEDIIRIGDGLVTEIIRTCLRCGGNSADEVSCVQGHTCCRVCYGGQCPRCGLAGEPITLVRG